MRSRPSATPALMQSLLPTYRTCWPQIWTNKTDMARKVRQRIGTVLNFAHGKGWRSTEAPGAIGNRRPAPPARGRQLRRYALRRRSNVRCQPAVQSPTTGRVARRALGANRLHQARMEPTGGPDKGQRRLSDMTTNKVLRTAGQLYDPHGFRSSFRDWTADRMPIFPIQLPRQHWRISYRTRWYSL